jgi:hypothetical protein
MIEALPAGLPKDQVVTSDDHQAPSIEQFTMIGQNLTFAVIVRPQREATCAERWFEIAVHLHPHGVDVRKYSAKESQLFKIEQSGISVDG